MKRNPGLQIGTQQTGTCHCARAGGNAQRTHVKRTGGHLELPSTGKKMTSWDQ